MNDNINDEYSPSNSHEENRASQLKNVRDKTLYVVEETSDYIRANPWKAVTGAALLGGIFAVLSHHQALKRSNHSSIGGWVEDIYSRFPRKNLRESKTESLEVSDFIKLIKSKIHLD